MKQFLLKKDPQREKRMQEIREKKAKQKEENEKVEAQINEMKKIRERFSELKEAIMTDDQVKFYSRFLEQKFKGKEKPQNFNSYHLGLKKTQNDALLGQLRRNDSKEVKLLKSDQKRASLTDLSVVQTKNFLGQFLESVTRNEKLPPITPSSRQQN